MKMNHKNNPRKESRRHFLKAALGMCSGCILLLTGIFDKLFFFFRGPDLSENEKVELLNVELKKINSAVKQKHLELERLRNDEIFVTNLSELNENEGKYFIDYTMKPGLAFIDENGLPILLSAKCTHLGCTIAKQVNKGQLLCPCHQAIFSVKTGGVIDGPALEPLPKIPFILKDEEDNIVTSIDEETVYDYDDLKIFIIKETQS